MNPDAVRSFVDAKWDDEIIPELTDYIKIPNKSPAFDPHWEEHGFMEDVVSMMSRWVLAQSIEGLQFEVVRLEGRTPLLYMEIPASGNAQGQGVAASAQDTVLLYGHLDKQPEMTGWREDLGPWKPVLEEGRLYGRGGADDGYALYASLTAIMALAQQDLPRARCVVIIEACEESGSYDLPYYIDALADRIGRPSLVVCLDSGCGNYDQLWCTTSLRGMVSGTLTVQMLSEGVHSGDASGVVASTFRIARMLLSRIEDEHSGAVLDPVFHTEIPAQRVRQAAVAAQVLGSEIYAKFPLMPGSRPMHTDLVELVLNRTWRPTLSVTGADGFPAVGDAGNVLRPLSALKLSLRLPPTVDPALAGQRLKTLLEQDPPYGAKVSFDADAGGEGWNAPALSNWLDEAAQSASKAFFGRECVYMGEGGSIPFMGMLGAKYPKAQFLISGVLGPHSNAHGPNEFLDIATGKRLTACVAQVLHQHCLRQL